MGADSEPRRTACILVVDDCRVNRDLMQLTLAADGLQVVTAASGAEAIAVL